MLNRCYLLNLCFLSLLIIIAVRTFYSTQFEFGDGREYVLQTQAIVFDHSLEVDPLRRAEYFNNTNPFRVQLDLQRATPKDQKAEGEARMFGGNFGALYLASDDSYRYIHSWVYSMVVAPVYGLINIAERALGLTGRSASAEYLAFRLVNICALFIPLGLLWRCSSSLSNLIFTAVLLASPITPHLQFTHPEVFCLGCILFSFVAIRFKNLRALSPLTLGLAAAQNIPIAGFFPLQMWFMWHQARLEAGLASETSPAKVLSSFYLSYLAAMLPPVSILLYNYELFGTFNPIVKLGFADFGNLSLPRLLSVFVSPMIGCLWYLPASWLAVVITLMRGQARIALLFVIAVVAVAALSSTTSNINSAQISACRYAVWFLAPLYVLPFLIRCETGVNRAFSERVAWTVGLTCTAAIALQFHTYLLLRGNIKRFYSTNRAVPEVAQIYRAFHLRDDIEPLVENMIGAELRVPHDFHGIYVWNLGDHSSLWIVSRRAMNTSPHIVVRANRDLSKVTTLQTSFDITTQRQDTYRLILKKNTEFEQHPYFGEYLMVWVPADVKGMRSQAPVTVLSHG